MRNLRKLTDDTGATAVEYGIMLAAIAGVIASIVLTLGLHVLALFQSASAGW